MVRKRRATARAGVSAPAQRAIVAGLLAALTGVVVGLAFAGSPERLAGGVRIAGVDVGGLTPGAARARLERRAKAVENVPIDFRAAGHSWRLSSEQLGIRADWHAAVEAVRRQGQGFGPVRGFRRLDLRFFGADVAPPTQVEDSALRYVLDRIGRTVDIPRHESAIVLEGRTPRIVAGRKGRVLDRHVATTTIVRALAGFGRGHVELPVGVDAPQVAPGDLQVAAAQVRTALSAPVRLTLGKTAWRLTPRRTARMLELPSGGRADLRIGGPGADRWFGALARSVDRQPIDADFAVSSRGIAVVPDRPGYSLDVPKSADALLRAVLVSEPTVRTARLTAIAKRAKRTTEDARMMHITGLVSSYTTIYGGEANRIHNVQLVAHLVDRHVIAPGEIFSFNSTTGERTAAKGFREAPVIINGELKTGLGGGVCQVSTTVFNAAYEAGLPITARTNHALYISHYPQGRDATVNYPDTDLKFINDTGHWLLLRTWVGSSSLTVALYGTPIHRRVVSNVAPLEARGTIPEKTVGDPALEAGARIVEETGEPARTTSVRRRVYDASGKLIYDATYYSSYRAEPTVARVGTKPAPQPEPVTPKSGGKSKPKPATTTTTTVPTTPVTTTTQP